VSDYDPYQLRSFDFYQRYKTPSTAPTGTICRVLSIPNDVRVIAAVNELLSMLTLPDVWEEIGISADEMLIYAGQMWLGYIQDECVVSDKYALIEDIKAQNTNGGTFTSGAWRTRTLNTVSHNDGIDLFLSSNEIILPVGVYRIKASAPAYGVNRHQIRLYNVTAAQVEKYGTSQYTPAADGVFNRSIVAHAVEIPLVQTTFRIEHFCETSRSTTGFGVACNFGDEIYTQVEIWQIPQ
jgi:hypothetical protein